MYTIKLPNVVLLSGAYIRQRRSFCNRSTGPHDLLQWAVGLKLAPVSGTGKPMRVSEAKTPSGSREGERRSAMP